MNGDSTWAEVLSRTDYYPFGLEMTGRTESGGYRYGFNGKEHDSPGIGGGGSTYDYGFRIYNPEIGKFLSVDPLTKSYPWYTPYQFAGNNPIKFIDLDGLEEYDPQRDAFFTARLLLTTFYDIKHSAENLILNTFVPADPGMKWLASYKVNESGEEIFETVIRQVPHQGVLKETFNTALDVVNIAAAGRLDPTDFISVRTGGNTQLTRGLRKFLDPTSFKQLPNEGLIDPSSIRFSQSSISPNFRNGSSIDDLVSGLRNGSIDPLSVDPIRIVERNGEIFTLDNRRLKAFQEAGVDIPFQKVNLDSLPKRELEKFTTTNNGESIRIRGTGTN
nr:RHS repeat-associated core domain-containing protein [Arthrospiribacter ruber]